MRPPRYSSLSLALAVYVLSTTWVFGQGVQSGSPQTAGTIRGTVLNSVTHEPIGRALVSSPGNEFATLTDSEGHFEFNVGCGEGSATRSACPSVLTARKPGFVERHVGYSHPVVPGKEVALTLAPEALIIGHVILPSSEAPDRIQVELYQRRVQNGHGRWVLSGSTQTRLSGEFRFAELGAGSYKLLTRELLDRDPLTFNPRGPLFGYPPACFPNATDFASAETIQLSPGKTFQAEIALAKHPYYPVKIPVVNAPPATGIRVNVSVQGRNGPGFALGYNIADQAISGSLPDGTYMIEASSFGATGSISITVRGGQVEGPRMTLVQNSAITVNVKEQFTSNETLNTGSAVIVHGSPPRRTVMGLRSYLNVHLEPADEFGENQGAWPRPPSEPDDDTLVIDNVQPGRYWVQVNSSRGYAASVTADGIDLQHKPLVVPLAGSIAPIEITLRDDWAEIECTIEAIKPPDNAEQQSSSHVYFVPQPDSPGELLDLWLSGAGPVSVQIPPGLYRVLTLESPLDDLEYHDAEAMREYESKGQVIRLAPGQNERLRVQAPPVGE